ncbi:MAG TPA: Hsp70 family protein [Friedmanniella sp.]
MTYELSVDLGTTFTAAAVRDDGEPVMVGLGNRALQVPSVLFRTDAGFIVGEAAERRGATEPRRLVREFKRRLGDPVPVLVDGVPFSAAALSATLLRWVVEAATRRQGGPPSGLVLTHPASWGAYKLDVLREVLTLAEVGTARWCPEPVAAAGQYASRSRVETGGRLAVYDLGGGTFDACVLQKTATGFEMLGPAEGVEHLGGVDFDEAVFEQVRSVLGERLDALDLDDPGTVAGLARLRRDCVEAKEALSVDTETTVQVALPGLVTSVGVRRAELEQLIRPALEQTVAAMARAIRAAGLGPKELSGIVLVGGSSRIPLVGEVLQRTFDAPTALDAHPKHDIALGALRSELWDTGSLPTVPLPATGRRSRKAAAKAVTPLPPPPPANPRLQSPRPPPPPPQTPSPQTPPPSTPPPSRTPAADGPGRRLRPLVLAGVAAVLVAAVALAVTLVRGGGTNDRAGAPTTSAPPVVASTTAPATPSPSPTPSLRALPVSAPLGDDQLVVSMHTSQSWDLYLASVDAPRPVRQLTSGRADEFTPVLSPDRRSVIYQYDADHADHVRTLHVMAADGTGDRELFSPAPSFCSGTMYRPAWNPVDPTELAVPCTDRSGQYGLYLVRTDGTLVSKIAFEGNRADDPTFGPDGRLVFWAGEQSRAQQKDPNLADGPLWVRELDGTVRRLPGVGTHRDADPAWSPDGSRLVFRRREPNGTTAGNLDIYVLTLVDGQLKKVIGTSAQEEDPSWSPDGRTLAFKSNHSTSAWPGQAVARTWLADADGSHRRLLLSQDAQGRQTAPAWTRR